MALFGGIEAGGTKFVCAVGSGPDDIRAETRFPTTTPEETLGQALAFFRAQWAEHEIGAIGMASFGPVDPDPRSPTYGYVTTTPKSGWPFTDMVTPFRQEFGLPMGFDTDVNAAALGENRWGAAQGLDTFVYWTVGTGLGGGGMVNGRLIHGLLHPEMGHMMVTHDHERDPFPGNCPYHGDCLEGLAAGPALQARWGQRGETLPPDHEAWALEAHYLALGLVNVITIVAPQRIILGGGVMAQPGIFPLIHKEVQRLLNGYIKLPAILEEINQYIVPPALGGRAGVMGAIALAQDAVLGQG
ncbi:MAG: ROK family protein [Caldilineaceae bacterium]|nr:ROK family protein [Caldilineaceae bacterium]